MYQLKPFIGILITSTYNEKKNFFEKTVKKSFTGKKKSEKKMRRFLFLSIELAQIFTLEFGTVNVIWPKSMYACVHLRDCV